MLRRVGELCIEDVELDVPEPHEVVVRTAAAGVCHSDLHILTGDMQVPLPIVLGHESSGIVERVGEDVRYVTPGDRVITCLSSFCGMCEFCLDGRPHLCLRQGMVRSAGAPPRLSQAGEIVHQLGLSSFAERMLVHENALVKIDPRLPLEHAALVGCGVLTGLGAVFRTAAVRPGDTVVVLGCGGVGLSCVQASAIVGAARTIAVDTTPWKLDLARQFGATDVVDASVDDPVEAVLELTSGGVGHVFEAVGSPATFAQAVRMTRRGGTTTMIGLMSAGQEYRLPPGSLSLERRIQGCSMGSNRFRTDIPYYVDLSLSGRLDLGAMVSARVPLDGVNDAFEAMRRGQVARTVVVFDDVIAEAAQSASGATIDS